MREVGSKSKICSYGLKISGDIEIKQVFQTEAFLYISDTLHTSCFSVLKIFLWLVRITYSGVVIVLV